MLVQIDRKQVTEHIKNLFSEVQFYVTKTLFQDYFGEIYVDDINNTNYSVIILRKYCYISGTIKDDDLVKVLEKFKGYTFIPSEVIANQIEKIYTKTKIMVKSYRYAIKKDVKFDRKRLEEYSSSKYDIKKIDDSILSKISKDKFINIVNERIGYCYIKENEIVGVCGAWYLYDDGYEVNIKVKDEYQHQGIATALASRFILDCLDTKREVSWDAANSISKSLAIKLGFQVDKKYSIYYFK